jgi:hypothetical protein
VPAKKNSLLLTDLREFTETTSPRFNKYLIVGVK